MNAFSSELFGGPQHAGLQSVQIGFNPKALTEQGEVFALRHAGLTAIAVTERFALSSLMFFDMRSTLRDLAKAGRWAGNVHDVDVSGPSAPEAEG